MTRSPRTHRLRAVTRAILWFPLACALAAAVFAAWLWIACGSARAVAPCRSEIVGEVAWAFAIVFAGGVVLLAAVWLLTLPFVRRVGIVENAVDRTSPAAPAPAVASRGDAAADEPAAGGVRPTRAARHAPPGRAPSG